MIPEDRKIVPIGDDRRSGIGGLPRDARPADVRFKAGIAGDGFQTGYRLPGRDWHDGWQRGVFIEVFAAASFVGDPVDVFSTGMKGIEGELEMDDKIDDHADADAERKTQYIDKTKGFVLADMADRNAELGLQHKHTVHGREFIAAWLTHRARRSAGRLV